MTITSEFKDSIVCILQSHVMDVNMYDKSLMNLIKSEIFHNILLQSSSTSVRTLRSEVNFVFSSYRP